MSTSPSQKNTNIFVTNFEKTDKKTDKKKGEK